MTLEQPDPRMFTPTTTYPSVGPRGVWWTPEIKDTMNGAVTRAT